MPGYVPETSGQTIAPISGPEQEIPETAAQPVAVIDNIKKPRVFMENPDNGLGMLLCGTVGDPDLHKGIGHLVEGELSDLKDGESVSLVVMITDLTDAEVEALPDV